MKKAALATIVVMAAIAAVAQADAPLSAVTQAPTAITDSSATLRGVVSPIGATATYYFEYGLTTAYGTETQAAQITVSPGTPTVQASVTGLLPATTYHYRLVAGAGGDTARGADKTFTTGVLGGAGTPGPGSDNASGGSTGSSNGDSHPLGGDAAPVVPVLGQSMGVGPASGSVRVRVPGGAGFVPLAGDAPVPSGSTIDARQGTVNLVTAVSGGRTQAAQFRGAVFAIRQAPGAGGMTDIYLRGGSFRGCSAVAPGRARVVAAARRPVRSLWGRDNHGRFRTHGRHAVATVRGTEWTVADRCDGTLTAVSKGAVAVRDRTLRKTVLVKAGHRYLARAKR